MYPALPEVNICKCSETQEANDVTANENLHGTRAVLARILSKEWVRLLAKC